MPDLMFCLLLIVIPAHTQLFLELIPCLVMSQQGSSSAPSGPFHILTTMGMQMISCS